MKKTFCRNHLCPNYDICLSQAAFDDRLLDCAACGYRTLSTQLYELRESPQHQQLSLNRRRRC